MTADLYATAAGLIERSAAAYVSGVPEAAADDGPLGPASVAWRVSTDLASPVAGLRSLLMQALHPLAMAGVDQHSGWRRDPVGRLAATSAYLTTVTFGDQAVALHAAARVRCIHDHVRGVDAVTGRPYAASDPALLLWVHAAQVDSVLAAGNLIGTAPSAADSDRYVAEMVTAAELVGVPRPLVPASVAELERYVASVRPGLSCTSAAAESMAYLLDPPGLDEEVAEIWQDVRDAAVAVLPEWARQMYSYDAPSLSPGRRTEIRQSLGVVDAMFGSRPDALLLPGGAVNAGRLRTEPAVQSFIQQINGAGKAMAVICHAPWGLVRAGLARGRTLTSYHTLRDDLRNAGATWADREVVVHGTLVTGRQPSDVPAFTREVLNLFAAARGA
jgi:uncharacterized protein (DUF2236 family)